MARAEDPPASLAKLVAHRETETEAERNEYMYRQTVTSRSWTTAARRAGAYREVRDIIFSPQHERTEEADRAGPRTG